ncbi:MAG: bifunctional 2-polyprenyl-6-hydroxyphenol methylase/3-demethylubiquinol 3-O-methyltransferase UbiG [Planctomycetes bacterium]|nr:bifunctional 2-polyprenyl-6-hydroxyphenol methylase/3-demethylubiquinol 3-O-methyltransferase UbiG [Planctomycetota bacterium]
MSGVGANDLELYERAAHAWWDPRAREFRSLRAVQAARFPVLASKWGARLDGARVVDLGCGGGLLSAPLVAVGARVIGVDVSGASLRAARARIDANFVRADMRNVPLANACADFVVVADVLEHVEDPEHVVAEAARLLRPGGELFVSTLNATWRARVLAVWLAEGVGLVPRGTHAARLFVAPSRLVALAAEHGLASVELWGESLRLGRTLASWTIELAPSRDLSVVYCARFVKGGAA